MPTAAELLPIVSPGFNVLGIPNLACWLDAQSITGLADADAVGTWSDLSGLGNNAVQATAAAKPLYKAAILNRLPVVRWDGVDDLMTIAGLTGTFGGSDVPYSMALVINNRGGGAGGTSYCFGTSDTPFCELQMGDGINRKDDAGVSQNVSGVIGDVNGAWGVLVVSFTGTTTMVMLNGVVTVTSAAQDVGALTSNRFALGARVLGAGYSNFAAIDTAEFIAVSRAISVNEAALLSRRLKKRWKL